MSEERSPEENAANVDALIRLVVGALLLAAVWTSTFALSARLALTGAVVLILAAVPQMIRAR